jgi:hypothetical protein
MSNIIQETVFPGTGLNWDDAQQFIASGDSPYRLNIMVSGNEASGIIVNALGNTRTIDITDHQLILSLTYVTIGSYYNRLTRKCYFFVFGGTYDSGGGVYLYDNRLLCYNEDSVTLDLIFVDTKNYFGLDLGTTFKDSSMLEDWLYFNPRISEPKMIDVVRAYNYTNYDTYSASSTYVYGDKVTFYGGLFIALSNVAANQTPIIASDRWDRIGDSYQDYSELAFESEFEYAFNVLKMPPIERPFLVYKSDTNINTNNIRGKIFRFSHRYKYFDNTYSSYSAFSEPSLPEDDEIYNGEIVNDATTNNYLEITFNAHSPALVKEVEIVVQEISGDWKRVKIINRQEQATITTYDMSFNFYNNESYVTVSNIEVAKVADYVPKRANSMEIINKNILAYGGCLEGFDNIPKEDIRVGLTPYLQSIGITPTQGTLRRNNITSNDFSDITSTDSEGNVIVGKGFEIGGWWAGSVVADDILVITIDGITSVYDIVAGDVASKTTAIGHIEVFLRQHYFNYDINTSTDADRIDFLSPFGNPNRANISQCLFCDNAGNSAELTKKKGFKTGANHPFCIYYYDENMRRWDAQTSKENKHIFGLEMHGTTVYVPMLNEYSPVPSDTGYKWNIDWEVYHLPPVGAKYWRWGYAGNSLCSKMVQYVMDAAADWSIGTVIEGWGRDMIYISIIPLQTLTTTTVKGPPSFNQYPNSIIEPYTWQKGDRIRFITEESVPGAGTDLGVLIDGVYDFEIIRQDTELDAIFIQGTLASTGLTAAGIGVNTLVEIYTPLKSIADTKTIFYEFGDLMPIVLDSAGIMVHAGQNGLHNQDTALSHTAIGTFDGGDIYHIMRTPSKPLDTTTTTKGAFHESMWYSDFYDSDDYDRGKIGFETSFGERFLNIVRYSRPYFQNTLINGLSTFEEDDVNKWPGYKEYNDIFGDIVSIIEQGDTLKVYQERKASSTLIGRTQYMDAEGNEQVMISNVVLGAIRYSPSNYSTVFPESLSKNNKFIYGVDIYNGVVWRDSVNGLFPISGRYAEAGGDADYKMQTYFKLKTKALMESGISHVSILTVWDEEYKLLYVIFKDSVVEANNDTIVFHEPSNRWISFTEFKQTPLGGYNMPLEFFEECYIIVKGFENGLGFVFDYDTRFATFNIGNGSGTTALTKIKPLPQYIRITTPTPRISSSPFVVAGNAPMLITLPYTPVNVSYIVLTLNSMTWTAVQYGEGDGQHTVLSLVSTYLPTSAILDSYSPPSTEGWIRISDGHELSKGDTIITGTAGSVNLNVYPVGIGTGARDGYINIKDVFGNVSQIYVSQQAPIANPSIWINIHPSDTSGLVLAYDWTAVCLSLGDELNLTFTVTHPNLALGSEFLVYWTITRKTGMADPIADNHDQFFVRNGQLESKTIYMLNNATGGEVITIYLSASYVAPPITPVNASISADYLPLVITTPTPFVEVTELHATVIDMTWDAADALFANKRDTRFSVVGVSNLGSLISKPSWVKVVNSSDVDVAEAYDGDTVSLYPSAINDGAIKTGSVVWTDTAGNTVIISVQHNVSLVDANVDVQIHDQFPYGSDGTTLLVLTGVSGEATNGDTNISITFTVDDPTLGLMTGFSMNYEIWKAGMFVGSGIIYTVLNKVSNTVALVMTSQASAGESIIVFLSEAI